MLRCDSVLGNYKLTLGPTPPHSRTPSRGATRFNHGNYKLTLGPTPPHSRTPPRRASRFNHQTHPNEALNQH